MNDELEEILSQNIAIRGFESINGDGEYFGNLDDASVEVLKEQIQAHTDKAVKEARINEVKRMREAMTFAHMTPSIYAAERIKNILGEVEL